MGNEKNKAPGLTSAEIAAMKKFPYGCYACNPNSGSECLAVIGEKCGCACHIVTEEDFVLPPEIAARPTELSDALDAWRGLTREQREWLYMGLMDQKKADVEIAKVAWRLLKAAGR